MYSRQTLVQIAVAEAKKGLVWSKGSEATKYTKKFEGIFGTGRFSWCAAFVTWCLEQAGLDCPIKFNSKFGYTTAYVEAWQQWAEEKGFYHDNDGKYEPPPGALIIFDWSQKDINLPDNDKDDHIGICVSAIMDGGKFVGCHTAEGNSSNKTGEHVRNSISIQGFVVIPEAFSFSVDAKANPKPVPATPKYSDDDAFVRAFQAKHGLNVDGDPGPKTYAAL